MDILYQEVGQRVKEMRESRNMTQQDLSDKIGLTRSSVANLELGRQRIQIHILYQIADALNISPLELLPPKSQTPNSLEPQVMDQDAKTFFDILQSKRKEGGQQ